jgi:hypothetical protein
MKCVNHPTEDAAYQCYRCQSPICVECETKVAGRSVCAPCLRLGRERIAARYLAETQHINYPGAVLSGLLAALALACVGSQIALSMGGHLGVGAALLGGIVGHSVMIGAGGKRGRPLQQMSAVLALVGILAAHFLILLRTGGYIGLGISGSGSSLLDAAYAFPSYLSSLSLLDALFLAVGTTWAYWAPHPRTLGA